MYLITFRIHLINKVLVLFLYTFLTRDNKLKFSYNSEIPISNPKKKKKKEKAKNQKLVALWEVIISKVKPKVTEKSTGN